MLEFVNLSFDVGVDSILLFNELKNRENYFQSQN